MSFDFNSGNISNNQFKAQSSYKDASGMGGGGMYFKQKKKKNEDEDDIFQSSKEEDESIFSNSISKDDVPEDTLFNKFVNWFNIKKDENL